MNLNCTGGRCGGLTGVKVSKGSRMSCESTCNPQTPTNDTLQVNSLQHSPPKHTYCRSSECREEDKKASREGQAARGRRIKGRSEDKRGIGQGLMVTA